MLSAAQIHHLRVLDAELADFRFCSTDEASHLLRVDAGLQPGTRVVFHLDPGGVSIDVPGGTTRATLRTYPDFFDLAGTVPVPPELSGLTWDEVRAEARGSRASRRSAPR